MATHDPLALSDEDRLPWLEPVDDWETPEPARAGGWIGWAAAGLALLALVFGGLWWWQNRTVEPAGSGELIAAPEGPYKIRPAEEGGMKIEGQGEMAFATSEGAQVRGTLDLGAVPEVPVARTAPDTQGIAAPKASAAVSDGGALVAKAPPAELAPEAIAGATIQLGAFPSQDVARKSWETLEKRFAYLTDRPETILKAEVNGRTFYRLRVGTGSAAEARDLCARLQVAGENCLAVN